MLRKLGEFTFIAVCSFCFFTFLFHTIAGAQAQSGDKPRPTPKPVSTVVQTKVVNASPTTPPTREPTMLLTAKPTPRLSPAVGSTTKIFALAITVPTPTTPAVITPTVTPLPTSMPTVTPLPTAVPSPTPLPATPTPTMQPTFPPTTDLDTLFSRYSDLYHADKETLRKIAKCESGFNSQAVNGPYLGMFQFASQTWLTNRGRMGLDGNPDLRTNPEEAIKTAAFMIGNGGANAWAGCL